MYYLPGSHRSWRLTDLQTHCPLSLSEWISCPHSQSPRILLEQSYQCEPCILSELPTIYMNIACKIEEDKTQRYCNFNQVWYGPMFQKKRNMQDSPQLASFGKKIKLGWSQNYRLARDFIQLFWLSLLTGRVSSRSLTEPYLTCYHSTWLWPWHLDKTWFKVTIHLLPTCIFYLDIWSRN